MRFKQREWKRRSLKRARSMRGVLADARERLSDKAAAKVSLRKSVRKGGSPNASDRDRRIRREVFARMAKKFA